MSPTRRHKIGRLFEWANRRLLPGFAGILLFADLGVGLNWLFVPASSLTSPAYDTAKMAAPMHLYGLLFALLAVVAAASNPRPRLVAVLMGLVLGGLWFFWAVLFTLAPLTADGRAGISFFGSVLSFAVLGFHLLTGAALYYRPAERT